MNMKKEMFLGVIFLVTAIIFVSSTPVINHAFAKSQDSQSQDDSSSMQSQDDSSSKSKGDSSSKSKGDSSSKSKGDSGSKNYENFLNCLSDASGSNSYPAGDQIVNCFAQSGYIQGSSSASNTADSQDNAGSVDVNALHDDKGDKKSSNDNGDKKSSNDNGDSSSTDNVKSSSNDNGDSSSTDNVKSSSNDNGDSSSNNSFIDSAYDDGSNE